MAIFVWIWLRIQNKEFCAHWNPMHILSVAYFSASSQQLSSLTIVLFHYKNNLLRPFNRLSSSSEDIIMHFCWILWFLRCFAAFSQKEENNSFGKWDVRCCSRWVLMWSTAAYKAVWWAQLDTVSNKWFSHHFQCLYFSSFMGKGRVEFELVVQMLNWEMILVCDL